MTVSFEQSVERNLVGEVIKASNNREINFFQGSTDVKRLYCIGL